MITNTGETREKKSARNRGNNSLFFVNTELKTSDCIDIEKI